MAYNWPSSHKAGTTTTGDADQRIDQARADINQNIVNVNEIIDMFDLASEPSNGQILKYNTTSDKFEVGADAGGIALTDLSVTQASASGGGTLAYNSSTGVFTYTPPVLSTTIGTHDIWIPAQAMYPTADEGCASIQTIEVVDNRPELRFLSFDGSTTEFAQFSIAMPKSWNEGTITFEVYWTAPSGSSGGVSWGLQGVAVANDEIISSTFGTAQVVDDTFIASTDLHITPTSSALTIAGSGGGSPTAGDLTFFQLYRDTADSNDTMIADARLLGVKIHYTTNAETDA